MLVKIYALFSVLALTFGLLLAPVASMASEEAQETEAPSVDAPPPIQEEAKTEGEMEEEHQEETEEAESEN